MQGQEEVAFPFSLRRLTCLGIDVLEKVEGCGGRYICVREKQAHGEATTWCQVVLGVRVLGVRKGCMCLTHCHGL